MTEFHHHGTGDQISVRGRHAVGKVVHEGGDPAAALRELVEQVQALRPHLSGDDRSVVDASVRSLQQRDADPGTLKRALGAIAGVAAVVGGVGVPVVQAVTRVVSLL